MVGNRDRVGALVGHVGAMGHVGLGQKDDVGVGMNKQQMTDVGIIVGSVAAMVMMMLGVRHGLMDKNVGMFGVGGLWVLSVLTIFRLWAWSLTSVIGMMIAWWVLMWLVLELMRVL